MAGIGSAWGSREEMLHPRDRHGRFRKKWKMAQGVVDALTGFLDRFQPRQFQSDQQASQYAFNSRKSPWTSPELQRLHTDWDDANESLQAGEMDDTTKKFVAMMDRNMVETTDDLIMSQTVPTTAFGLSPQQAQLEDGGLEDLIGLEIADAGYSAWNLGSELSHPPGSVTIRAAVPKGTRVAFGGRSPSDRSASMDRDQPLVITKVEPDGRGGWYMLAIAGSGARTKGATAVASDRTHGRRGGGLTPEQREARISPQMSGEERLRIAQQNAKEMETGPSTPTPAPSQAPAPAAPVSPQTPAPPAAGVPERREPVQSEAVGPGSPVGKSPSDIATDAEAAKVQAENAPPVQTPATPESFRQALATTDLKAPSRGKRQKEFDAARTGIVSGKQAPQDALRQLETDIEVNKRQLERQQAGTEKPDPELGQDIKDQEALADLISSHHGVPRRGQAAEAAEAPTPAPAAPTKRATKAAGPKATPGAPSTKKEGTPKAPEAAPDRRTKKELLEEAGDAGRARMTKAQLLQAIEHKKARDAEPAPVPEAKAPGSKFTPAQEEALITRAKKFRGNEKNSEDERIVREADEILARRAGTPAKKAAAKKAAPEAPVTPVKKVTKRAAKKAAPQTPAEDAATDTLMRNMEERQPAAAKAILDDMTPEERQSVQEARERHAARMAAKKAPAKAVAKKAVPAKAAPSPVDAEEEAFKARVTEAGLPDRVAALRDMAREQKIRGFSTMNKRQLQSALMGDEVPKAGKIGVVSPAKMVPHLEAADSDQAARALLEKHTLVDLKALAKHREIKLPSRGATKGKVTDMVLEDIRGPQEGIGGRTPDTGLPEDLGQMGYITLPGANGDKISQEIAQAVPDDPESLRRHRDNLEGLSKQFRGDGDKQGANMAQAAADAMGMRAQTISGVEEGAPPVKRVAKKAVPAVDPDAEPEPKTLDKMLKPELEALATKEGVPGVRKSMTKAQLKDAIEKNRRMDSSRGGETDEERIRRELGTLPGGAERFQGPAAGPLQLPDRAPTMEEIARDNPDLDVQKLFNDAGIPTNDPGGLVGDTKLTLKQEGPEAAAKRLRTEADRMIERIPEARAQSQRKTMPTPFDADKAEADVRENADKIRQVADKIEAAPPVKKATKKAAKKAVADVDKAAGGLAAEVRSTPAGTGQTFGDILRQTDAEELRQAVKESGLGDIEGKTAEEIFDNTIKKALGDRMRELGMLPEDPKKPTKAQKRVPKGSVKGPKADQPITTPGRRDSFMEAWDKQGFGDDASLGEIRDDIASGNLSQEEGVRRIESEISFNEEEISDLGAELRGMSPEDRDPEGGTADSIHARRAELSDKITAQKKAVKFLRSHAKKEAPATLEEIQVSLDPEESAALQRIQEAGPEGIADLKRSAKDDGLGDIEGDDLDTVVQNIARKVAGRELANREKEQRARDRQSTIDEKGKVAEALSNLDQMAQNGGSDKALRAGIRRLPAGDREQLTEALSDRDLFRQRLDTITKSRDLSRFGTVGETVPYDPQKHDVTGDVAPGSPVLITRAGHDFRPGDGSTVSFKARVIPDEGSKIPAKTAPSAPKAAVPAPGTAAGKITAGRVTPGTRILVKQDPQGVWRAMNRKTGAIPVEVTEVHAGARGRRLFKARDDQGNIIDVDGAMGERGGGLASHQTLLLEPSPKAPKAAKAAAPSAPEAPAAPAKKAAKFLPPLNNGQKRKSMTNVEVGDLAKRAGMKGDYSRVTQIEHDRGRIRVTLENGTVLDGAPQTSVWIGDGDAPEAPAPAKKLTNTQDLLGELINDDNPMSREEVGSRIADLDRAQLQEMARSLGIPAGSRRTIPDTRRSIVEATVGRRLDSIAIRGFRGDRPGAPEPDLPEDAPARLLAESHKVTSTPLRLPPKVVDLDQPTRHNAEVIGTGLDLDAKGEDKQWLAVVQKDLDNGVDGRQIADGLRRGADSERTLHNIEAGSGGTDSDTGRAARINRMELMADRLEGVRPIQKAAPPAPAKAAPGVPAKREMDTMQAATAQSKALSDLRNGKSHTEVATALRQAATGVGSREHDPQTVRPLAFTPSERSAMKRGDAKRLRELAAEIQAQGVAERAEARAAKKAASPAGKKAAKAQTEFVEKMAGERAAFKDLGDKPAKKAAAPAKGHLRPDRGAAAFSDDPEIRAQAAKAFEAREAAGGSLLGPRAAKPAAPKKRTAAEMRRARNAAESEGVPVEQVLERWDGQKEDRKNLTGPVGEMIAAQIEDAHQALLAADTPSKESEATGRLLHPELRTWATKLGLSPSGTKRVLEQRIADRIKGREAPGVSAERAVPQAPGGMTTQPPKPLEWGNLQGQIGDGHYFHGDGEIPLAMDRLGPEAQIDVGSGESLHNAMGDIATDLVMGRINGDAAVARLRALATKLPAGSGARNMVASLAEKLDAPAVAMPRLPDDTPGPLRRLLQQTMTFPIARATGRHGMTTYGQSLVDKIADFIREKASGESSVVGIADDLARMMSSHSHESQEGSMGLKRLADPLFDSNSDITKALLQWAKEIRARRRAT